MWEKVAFLNILWFEYKSTVLKCQVSALKIQFSSKNQLFYFIRYFKNSIYSKFWRSLKVNPTQNASLDIEVCATFYSNSRATAWGLVILKINSKILILYYELQKKKILEIFWGNFFFREINFFALRQVVWCVYWQKELIWYNFRPHQNLAILEHYHCAWVLPFCKNKIHF